MYRKALAILLSALMTFSLAACGGTDRQSAAEPEAAQTEQATADDAAVQTDANIEQTPTETVAVDNTLALDTDALVKTYADKFKQETYTDADTGLSITYNLFLPEGYDASGVYPMVVFIGDSTCVGSDTYSLTQGRGALVWASDAWQSVYPTIVAVPTYPVTILDDHSGYTTTEYVELTKRFIDAVAGEYAVDASRIYGTGQSMGCMTTLILASEYPDLYAACMFVDGQWDVATLAGLKNQSFVYFAAEDDTNAWNGAQEVMAMFDADSVDYAYAQWDGTWEPDQLSTAAQGLLSAGKKRNFISWAAGTIETKTGGMGGGSGQKPSGGFGGGSGQRPAGAPDGSMQSGSGSSGGGMGSVAYHMASFDYAYNCIAVMEWLFGQSK